MALQNLQSNGDLFTRFWKNVQLLGDIYTRSQQDLKSKGNIVLTTLANLRSAGSISEVIQRDLGSKANICFTTYQDLKSKADLFMRSWEDVKSQGNIEILFYPKAVILEEWDQRGRARFPVSWKKISTTIPAGSEAIYPTFTFNGIVKQLSVKIPDIGSATVTIQLLDEIGAVLYEKTGQTGDQTIALFPPNAADKAYEIHLAGNVFLGLKLTAVQATDKTFETVVYGI